MNLSTNLKIAPKWHNYKIKLIKKHKHHKNNNDLYPIEAQNRDDYQHTQINNHVLGQNTKLNTSLVHNLIIYHQANE